MTLSVREAVEQNSSRKLRVVLDGGTYFCKPDLALQKYCAITNHGNGSKKILFNFKDFDSVEIEGNGARLIFHGQMFPFLFENCSQVKVSDLSIDWDIPFLFLAEVTAVNPKEQWREIRPLTNGYSWKWENGTIMFPDIDGFSYTSFGSTLPFEPSEKKVVEGALDVRSDPYRIEKRPGGVFRVYEKLRYYPPVGSLLNSKGDRQHDRYAPAFDFKDCRNILLDNITVHHALGMGFLFERSENIQLLNSRIILPENTDRVVSTTADATHFANCKGQILIEGCRFENMLDDASNVHGVYLEIDDILSSHSVRVALKHFEQWGFKFAEPGDELWFLIKPSSERVSANRLKDVKVLNEMYAVFTFQDALPAGLKKGDILENKTWNADYTVRNCRMSHHRARNLIISTPGKVLIENNEFSSMMSSILLGGETVYWFESGAAQDVIIRNNKFLDCAYCSPTHSVLYSRPKLGDGFDAGQTFTRNVRFVGNTVIGHNPSVVQMYQSAGLVVKDNKIEILDGARVDFSGLSVIRTEQCPDAEISGNEVKGWPLSR